MVKKIAVISPDKNTLFEAINSYFKEEEVDVVLYNSMDDIKENYELLVFYDYNGKLPKGALNLHPSLLPAFEGEDAIKKAFIAGVKVSGVTVVHDDKIIAQYPVLIGNSTHFDEFEAEMNKIGNILYPIVIDKILKDEVFDFSDLIGGCGSSGCGNCGGCH